MNLGVDALMDIILIIVFLLVLSVKQNALLALINFHAIDVRLRTVKLLGIVDTVNVLVDIMRYIIQNLNAENVIICVKLAQGHWLKTALIALIQKWSLRMANANVLTVNS